ncbi:MAG: NAD(P)H-quinone oxidoreductase, partial [Gammaproteobacteria bacterium]|nr:NAD(P)H-quinone oxidoreductase [Gammaproteobacteria bacterium]
MRHIAYGPDPGAGSLRVVTGPVPVPSAGELLIAVDHAGVNRPDVQQRAGSYPPPPGASPILGLEVSGKVAMVGAGVEGWKVGDAVCALTPGGGYAQYCLTPAGQALPVPRGWSLEQAAGLCETWFTVWANLVDIGGLRAGQQVLVHGGSSGIGLAAIELIRLRGAQCIVTVGDDEKARFCRGFGAQAAINYKSEDFVARVRELTAGAGVDLVLDMVAGDYVPRNLQVLRRDGRELLIALQRGTQAEVDLNLVMRNRLTITGSTMRPRTSAEKTAIRDALRREVWPACEAGHVRVHVHAIFPLAQAADAHRLMESSRHIGKILLR